MPDQDLPRSVPVPADVGTFPAEQEQTTGRFEWTEVVVIKQEVDWPVGLILAILAVMLVGSVALIVVGWLRRRPEPTDQGKNKAT